MGPADLACAECNCFPYLMVNLRPAWLSDSPSSEPPTPAVPSRDRGPTLGFTTHGLWDFGPQPPHLKHNRLDLDHRFLPTETLFGLVLQSGCPGKI